jgi:hypothetical protein
MKTNDDSGPVILQDWSVYRDPYHPPEVPSRLKGRVFGHHRKPDGEWVMTSSIEDATGRLVTTSSGTVYQLGCIERGYRKWLRDNGYDYDPKRPVVVKVAS